MEYRNYIIQYTYKDQGGLEEMEVPEKELGSVVRHLSKKDSEVYVLKVELKA